MARIYITYCINCNDETNHIHDDMSVGSTPDRCLTCGKNIWDIYRDQKKDKNNEST